MQKWSGSRWGFGFSSKAAAVKIPQLDAIWNTGSTAHAHTYTYRHTNVRVGKTTHTHAHGFCCVSLRSFICVLCLLPLTRAKKKIEGIIPHFRKPTHEITSTSQQTYYIHLFLETAKHSCQEQTLKWMSFSSRKCMINYGNARFVN